MQNMAKLHINYIINYILTQHINYIWLPSIFTIPSFPSFPAEVHHETVLHPSLGPPVLHLRILPVLVVAELQLHRAHVLKKL